MTNKEKAKEISLKSGYLSDFPHHEPSVEYGAIKMAKWKDEQYKWHKFSDGELPREEGDYLLVMKLKYATKEGTSKPYMSVSSFSMKDGWKDCYGDSFAKETILIAWMELPKYEEK